MNEVLVITVLLIEGCELRTHVLGVVEVVVLLLLPLLEVLEQLRPEVPFNIKLN